MKRMFLIVALLAAWPIAAGAQTPPPIPPAPQMPPMPPIPPTPRILVPDLDLTIQDAMQQAREAVARIDMDQVHGAITNALNQVHVEMPDIHLNLDHLPMYLEDMQDKFRVDMSNMNFGGDAYSMGLSAITQKQYDRAITRFDQVIAQKSAHADGALYWKAFAKYKQGKSDEALASIAELRKSFGQSRYLNDAKALEADAKKLSGQAVKPEDLNDDDLKLLALQGLMHSDPAGTIPVIETMLAGTNSLSVKKRALYLLALSDQPKAHQILLSYAKGAGNPDLQRQAIIYIASADRKQTTNAELSEIYNSTQDADVKKWIIDAYTSAGDARSLLTIASGSGPLEIRRQAINGLTSISSDNNGQAPAELWQLYQKEENKDLRLQMVRAFSAEQLAQVLKTEKDPAVRRQVLRSLGNRRRSTTTVPTLVEAYGAEQDKENKRIIISSLGNMDNAEALVAIARKETSVDLKMAIVEELKDSKSKVAQDYLREILGGK